MIKIKTALGWKQISGATPTAASMRFGGTVTDWSELPAAATNGTVYINTTNQTSKIYNAASHVWEDLGSTTLEVDSALSETSTNPVQNKVISAVLKEKVAKEDVESTLSTTSVNPVQNKTVTEGINKKQNQVYFGETEPVSVEGDIWASQGATDSDVVTDVTVNGASVVKDGVAALDVSYLADAETSSTTLTLKKFNGTLIKFTPVVAGVMTYRGVCASTDLPGKVATANVGDYYVLSDVAGSCAIFNGTNFEQTSASITVDTALSTTSNNPVENRVITAALNEARNIVSVSATGTSTDKVKYITINGTESLMGVDVDDHIESGSINPVQNKVIKTALDGKVGSSDITEIKKMTRAEYDALTTKDPKVIYDVEGDISPLSIDTALSTSSTNPVQNKAIATAVNNLESGVNACETTKINTTSLSIQPSPASGFSCNIDKQVRIEHKDYYEYFVIVTAINGNRETTKQFPVALISGFVGTGLYTHVAVPMWNEQGTDNTNGLIYSGNLTDTTLSLYCGKAVTTDALRFNIHLIRLK